MNRFALLAAFSLADPALAGVVSRDLFQPGDGLLTYDDVNQREWLDFSVSARFFDPGSLSLGSLPAELSEFRLATLADVDAFMASASVPQVEAWTLADADCTAPDLIEVLGETGRFSGSVLGDLAFTGGYVSRDTSAAFGLGETTAVLAFNFGVQPIPGALNRPTVQQRTSGYYHLDLAGYPFAVGPIDSEFPNGFIPTLGGEAPTSGDPVADDLNGNGSDGFVSVVRHDGQVIGRIIDFGDLYEFNVFWKRVQGSPAFWLYRDAVAVPEPAAGLLALAACLGALRLRGLA